MPSLHPQTKDSFVLSLGAGAARRLSLARGALELLLDPPPGVRTRRAPLMLGRDAEAGEVTLSRTRRTLELRVHDPPRLLLAKAEDARRLLRGELNALALVEATDGAAGGPPADARGAEAAEEKRRAQQARLRDLVARRLGDPRPPAEGPPEDARP